jgi:hypothetical protein
MPKTDTMTTAQVAARLRLNVRSVRRLMDAGRITPVYKLPTPTGPYLFDAADVEALAAERAK